MKFQILSIFVLLFVVTSCENPPDEKQDVYHVEPGLSLELFDTWSTSALLNFSLSDTTTLWTLSLTANDSLIFEQTGAGIDSGLICSNLTPNSHYEFKAFVSADEEIVDSVTINTTTIDSISNNISWNIHEFEGLGGYFNNCSIVNENSVWIVGEMRRADPDSSYDGSGFENIDLIHWDGNSWEEQEIAPNAHLLNIHSFADDDIWVLAVDRILHFQGEAWEEYVFEELGINIGYSLGDAIWGPSPNNIYFGGDSGRVAHWDGNTLSQIDADFNIHITDVCGSEEDDLLVLSSQWYESQHYDRAVIFTDAATQGWSKLDYPYSLQYAESAIVHAISLHEGKLYLVHTEGIWIYDFASTQSFNVPTSFVVSSPYMGETKKIHVESKNNWIMMDYGMRYYSFNGSTIYGSNEFNRGYAEYHGGDYKDGVIAMVSSNNIFVKRAIIGVRQ